MPLAAAGNEFEDGGCIASLRETRDERHRVLKIAPRVTEHGKTACEKSRSHRGQSFVQSSIVDEMRDEVQKRISIFRLIPLAAPLHEPLPAILDADFEGFRTGLRRLQPV